MALVSSTIPNLINGVSQQPAEIRLPSQCEVQENALSSVVDGLSKRPPTQHVAKIIASTLTNASVHVVDRDENNRETGSNLKPPQPKGGSRKKSYCARSAGIKKCKNPDKNGDCPNDIARRKWKC